MIHSQYLKLCFSSHIFVQVEENQVKHAESSEGTSERTGTTNASCHCIQLTCIEQI